MENKKAGAGQTTCPNCYQQYTPEPGDLLCPYCGYSGFDGEPIRCPGCGREFIPIDDEPMCPFCGFDAFGESISSPPEATDDGADGEEPIRCPGCGAEFIPIDDEPMCPICGFDAFGELTSPPPEATDDDADEEETICCPGCGAEFIPFKNKPMCPFCGCDAFGESTSPQPEAADEGADEARDYPAEDNADIADILFDEDEDFSEADDADEAEDFSEADDADEAEDFYEVDDADEAEDFYEADDADEAEVYYEADDADEAEVYYEADDADEAEDFYEADDADEAEDFYEADDADEAEDFYEADDADKAEDFLAEDDADEADEAGKWFVDDDEDETEDWGAYKDPTDRNYSVHIVLSKEKRGGDFLSDTVDIVAKNEASQEDVERTHDVKRTEDVNPAEPDADDWFAGEESEFHRCIACMKELSPGARYCKFCGCDQQTVTGESCHLPPGSMLADRYYVGKSIGAGGFGITYIGWDTTLMRRIAIKEYMPTAFATRAPGKKALTVFTGEKANQFEIGKKKFKEEGHVLAGCQSVSGVVNIYDVFAENGTSYLIMEYLEGETLKERLKREGTLSEEEALGILLPVLEALESIHSVGLIHRDVAPDNIFLCKNGDVKLIDFGAARYATTSYSRSLSVILKSGYSPEEQYRSKGEQGPWTDVYAAGATLYRMLTGANPPDAMERYAYDELRGEAGVPEWVTAADRKYRHLKLRIARRFYQSMTHREADEEPTDSLDLHSIDKKSERRESMALNTYRKLTGSYPEMAKAREESFIANQKLAKLPRNIYIAMMNAMNVDKDYRTQSALQFRKELTGETKATLIRLKRQNGLLKALPTWFKTVSGLAAALVLVCAVSLTSLAVGAVSNEAEVPEIINKMTDEAEDLLTEKELEYMIVDSKVSDKVPENKVMFQEPEALTKVEKGSVVKATISMGAEKVSVPNFVGMTKKEAEEALSQLNLKAEYAEDYSSVEKGRICLQDTEAGSRVAVGTTVKLTVSLGLEDVNKEENVTVPKVTDLTLEEAKSSLEAVNLYLSVESEQYNDKPAGTVISQSVREGTAVKQGTTVKVVVSKGKETVVVPYVTYKTENEAIKLLKNANLKHSIKYEYHDTVAKGNVISQSIEAEKTVAPGTTVELIVSKGKKTVTVPNVVGKKSNDAVEVIEEKGLQVNVKEENNDSVAAGNVIRQTPAAKKEVENGSTVTIYVSKGSNSVSVPSVKGKTSAAAKTALENKGLKVKIIEQYSDTVGKGKVISQSPNSDSSLARGSTVTIYVSKGKQPVTVPNVVGKRAANAQYVIWESGFQVDIEEDYSNTVADGNVISQSPAANTSAIAGSTITITVSIGKEPTTVPDVVGKTSSSAKSSIQSAGLVYSESGEYSETVKKGTVIRQSPTGGSYAGKGDTVTVTVSKGKQPVTVPDVSDKSSTNAQNSIISAGFKVKVVEGYSDSVSSGYVIKQSPGGNTSAYKGDTITITVSKGASQWSAEWVTSLPSGVSESKGYEIQTKTQYQGVPLISEQVVGNEYALTDWTTERQSTGGYKREESKKQYQYYRVVCWNCGDDWYGGASCQRCSAKYTEWQYMWYDKPHENINWERVTSDGGAYRAKLGTNVNWYYCTYGGANSFAGIYKSRTVYKYYTRDVSTVTKEGTPGEWTFDRLYSSSTLKVNTRKVYKYRVKPIS